MTDSPRIQKLAQSRPVTKQAGQTAPTWGVGFRHRWLTKNRSTRDRFELRATASLWPELVNPPCRILPAGLLVDVAGNFITNIQGIVHRVLLDRRHDRNAYHVPFCRTMGLVGPEARFQANSGKNNSFVESKFSFLLR